MSEGDGDGSGGATGVQPGALTALLQEVAASPEKREEEPLSLPPGTVIGRFEIIRELGRGGFGVVYEAKDRDLGRQVAVKFVRPGRITEEEGKVSREAEAIARLAHPNLITLHEVGRSEHGPFLVFELLRGKTLDLRIEEGPLPVREAVHIATEVARGLAHAHAEGVIHRDLKPANVFVTNKGQVKVLDFGMAHAFGRRRLSGGTPAYMAPEQWEDDPEDERTDVFALGVMLHRMLTGEYPFPEGKGKWSAEPATLRKLDVPGAPELADLVEKMLDRTPKGRPRDGAAVLAALTPIEDRLRAKPADGTPPVHAKRRKATFGDLLAELKRRHVFRVMVGYGIFSFAVLQVTEPIMHGAGLPDWVLTVVLVALVMGFPVAVILAWVYDLTAQGVKRTPSATGPGAPRVGRARLLLPLAVAAVVLAIATGGAGAWYAWKRAAEHPPVAAVPGAGPSIAVMPFTDMNPGQEQDYFGDGIAEEILGALSRVAGLRVPGRSSSFWFKGKNLDPAEIARKLGVTHLLEGTVRRSGSKLRISAEVVKASNGERVWSETYEREVTDVFAIQDEIARSVVRELAPMLLARTSPPPPATTTDPEAYRLFLLGRAVNAQGTRESYRRAKEALERSVAIDPRFAPAQAYLAVVLGNCSLTERGGESQRLRSAGKAAAERAIAIDPSSPWGYISRAWYRMRQDLDWAGAAEDIDRALGIDPNNESILNVRALLLTSLGRTKEAVDLERRAVDLSPLNAVHTTNLAYMLMADGQYAEAREWARRSLEISPENARAYMVLGHAALANGDGRDALASYGKSEEPIRSAGSVAALHSLGRGQESRDALVRLERDYPDEPIFIAGARAWRGDRDGAFAELDRAVRERSSDLANVKNFVLLRPFHGDPRFDAILRSLNLPVGQEATPASPAGGSDATPSIAVLPFADMSPKHDQEYFADGVAEEILNSLAQVQGLKVIGRTSSFSFKGKTDDLKTIGKKLGVANVLEGSLRKDGSGIRISAKLIRVADGTQLWSERYDRKITGIFKVQDEIAKAVVGALKVSLLPGEATALSHSRTTPDAYLQYLLGYQSFVSRGVNGVRKSVAAYERSLALDPGYAPAWAGLAWSLDNLSEEEPDLDRLLAMKRRASEAADRAVVLGPAEGRAYYARGGLRASNRYEWVAGLADLENAIKLNGSDGAVYRVHGRILAALGRVPEAISSLKRATELEPLSAVGWVILGRLYNGSGQFDQARSAFRKVLEVAPDYDTIQCRLGDVLLLEGRPAEALLAAGACRADMWRLTLTAMSEHSLGHKEESSKALGTLIERNSTSAAYQIAEVSAWRGESDNAFEWLARADAQMDGGLMDLQYSPFLRSIHADPRWKFFLKKLNFPVE